jgi:hypothetical protein
MLKVSLIVKRSFGIAYVHKTAVDVAELLEAEKTGAMSRIVKSVALSKS